MELGGSDSVETAASGDSAAVSAACNANGDSGVVVESVVEAVRRVKNCGWPIQTGFRVVLPVSGGGF